MTRSQQETGTDTLTREKREVPDISHRLCWCQQLATPAVTWCGMKVDNAPASRSFSGFYKPIEICVFCTEVRMADTVCPHCGLRPSEYPTG